MSKNGITAVCFEVLAVWALVQAVALLSPMPWMSLREALAMSCLPALVMLLGTAILLVATHRLSADARPGVPPSDPAVSSLLLVGLRGLGLFFAVQAIAGLAQAVGEFHVLRDYGQGLWEALGLVLPSALFALASGLLLMQLPTSSIARFPSQRRSPNVEP